MMPPGVIDGGPGWIVVDKPAGISVHNEPGRDLVSLVADRLRSDSGLADRVGYREGMRPAPAHRLDRDTSGVILFGLHADMLRFFARQFETRRVDKHYLALVHGQFDEPDLLWDAPLSPDGGGRTQPAGKGKKVDCRTRVRVLEQSPHYALIACELLTGRKHQIRRHARLGGHPVLGDERYGSKRAVDFVRTRAGFDRLGLHAHRLELILPGSPDGLTFTSPMPQAFVVMLDMDKVGG
ncbi:hypothetical protein JCM14469_12000 [Desulfatiferula olefinivorans]